MTNTKTKKAAAGSIWDDGFNGRTYEIRETLCNSTLMEIYRAFEIATDEPTAYWAYTIDDLEMQLEDHRMTRRIS